MVRPDQLSGFNRWLLASKNKVEPTNHVESFQPGNPSNPRNDNIQHLRAIACLLVLCHHFVWLRSFLPPIFWHAWSGVDLFFAISGYVVTLSLARTLDIDVRVGCMANISANAPAIRSFLVKRIWRIFPPLVATLGLLVLLTLVFNITK